jgi:methylase of polypeptide subunit release factors
VSLCWPKWLRFSQPISAVGHDEQVTTALFDDRGIDRLRLALGEYTVDSVHEIIGLVGQAAQSRGDLAGLARQVTGQSRLETLIRLFLVGSEVPEAAARAALHPLPLEQAERAGLLAASSGAVRARLDVRPYAQDAIGPSRSPDGWWVISDFGSDVRGGPLAADHVLGIGAASLTLAQATPRGPVGRALDIGTGCGVQSLHLATHADSVVATDVSHRALTLAATTAALSGQSWDLRAGSLLEPVDGERFDLVVANPPFVVSAGTGGYDYRDSGLAGDGVCEALVTGLPDVLSDHGTAQLLANWIIPADRAWPDRLADWLAGRGCDAWVWQREVAEPAEYVALWLRDAGESPGTPSWSRHYNSWLDWFAAAGVAAIGMGLITLWRTDSADPVVVIEDVPQPVEQPIGVLLPDWLQRQRWLASTRDDALLDATLAPAPGLVRDRSDLLGPDGWAVAAARLRQSYGMRWELDVDEPIAALVAGCDGRTPLRTPLSVLAAALDRPAAEVTEAALPVVRDLVGRGFLSPAWDGS